jgi:dynein heavy chain
LRTSKTLSKWDGEEKDSKHETFYEMIAIDKEIVKVILLLTGSIQGTRNKVSDFLASFKDFKKLWTDDIND